MWGLYRLRSTDCDIGLCGGSGDTYARPRDPPSAMSSSFLSLFFMSYILFQGWRKLNYWSLLDFHSTVINPWNRYAQYLSISSKYITGDNELRSDISFKKRLIELATKLCLPVNKKYKLIHMRMHIIWWHGSWLNGVVISAYQHQKFLSLP